MPRDHFPRHLSMHGIRIIQQRRTQERKAPMKQHPQSGDGEENLTRTPREVSRYIGFPKQRRHALLRNDFQARDELKVPAVEAGHIETEPQSRDPDDEVLEWYGYPLDSLFPFDASDHPGHLDRDRMHRHITAQPIDEGQSTLFVGVGLCAICTVGQLGDRDDGETDIDFTITVLYLFEDLADGVTSTLGGDHNT
jgi:hypothetical protein